MSISRNLSFLAEGVSSTGVLGVSNGGSGASTLTGYLYGNGTSAFTASTTIPTSALSGTISNAQLANSSLTVNGTSISLGGSGTVTAAAGTLTGTTLNSTVVSSSLTSVGTLTSGTWNASTIGAIYGGTGQNTVTTGDLLYGSASNTISKLAIGSTGTILRVVGGVPTWGTDYTGTVTSVAASVPSFLSISGSPITTSGTLAITYSGTALPIANGGTAQTSFTSGQILYGSFNQSSNLTFDGNNVGIGITPSSFSSSWKVLQIGYGAFAQSSAGNDAPQILANTYYNGSNYIYQLSDTACRFQTNNPGFTWYVAPSGTAGNPITFTAAMNISGSGGVSIGNTTDPGAGNLRFNTTGTNGIYFGSSSILTDYETGTWTPSQGSGLTVVGTFSSAGTYTKIGRLVMVNFNLSATTSISANAGAIIAGNFPYAPSTGSGLGFNGSTTNSTNTAYNGVFIYSTSMYIDGILAATSGLNITITYNV